VAALTIGGIGAKAFHEYPRLDVYTENGHARLRGRNHTWVELEWALRSESETHRFSAYPEQLGSTRYTHALTQFVNCIRNGTPPPATVADGVRSVRLAQAVYRSVRSGSAIAVADLDAT
jgi:predicted dehydrogenase